MVHEIESQWMGKMQFNALVQGHTIIMDAPERVGGEDQGPIPKPFLLSALSGCTGMDVVKLLRQDGRALTDFSIKVAGEISKQPPLEYVAVHLVYEMKGKPEDLESALNAVRTSQGKICGISHMLKKIIPVTWAVEYNGQQVLTNQEAEVPQDVCF
ncbi:MAG TPA: OsmC family protein [Saprospiraceae bacterium]|nr:OsmC family protein [Saprospiraceae bacterium]